MEEERPMAPPPTGVRKRSTGLGAGLDNSREEAQGAGLDGQPGWSQVALVLRGLWVRAQSRCWIWLALGLLTGWASGLWWPVLAMVGLWAWASKGGGQSPGWPRGLRIRCEMALYEFVYLAWLAYSRFWQTLLLLTTVWIDWAQRARAPIPIALVTREGSRFRRAEVSLVWSKSSRQRRLLAYFWRNAGDQSFAALQKMARRFRAGSRIDLWGMVIWPEGPADQEIGEGGGPFDSAEGARNLATAFYLHFDLDSSTVRLMYPEPMGEGPHFVYRVQSSARSPCSAVALSDLLAPLANSQAMRV